MNKNVYKVQQLNNYIGNMFAQDFMLKNISVEGEVSNCKYHSSGHIYFSLKDEKCLIKCVMFKSKRAGINFTMKDGDCVVVTGSVEVFERDGIYQMYAREIEHGGEGDLFLKFNALKEELEEMGMFATEYKRPIPKYIRTLGVVTASTGAAIRDIQNIVTRRNPKVKVILYPALVQGEGAKESIVNGINALEQIGVDVIIVGRGGGSLEDLWAFNERIVAEAIFNCSIPIISAVGHETDYTISDFVSDLRAPTPSAAAELAVYNYLDLINDLENYNEIINQKFNYKITNMLYRLKNLENTIKLKNPNRLLSERKAKINSYYTELKNLMNNHLAVYKYKLEFLAQNIDSKSPTKRLSGGYAFVTDKYGKNINSVNQLETSQEVNLFLKDGRATAKILEIEKNGANYGKK
ncbi:exodeoxyribonuclease VII large subunit [Lachnobacterium bovis]|uniref:exodeoxyribonuclease VII large subunit n=1 Tax=Lachnobacterium bovis TaxID=140626 RepID=UPI0003B6D93D|nr:exodeoxyribonuclease VII large subunit [Lachnobacterium bovis]